MWVLFNNNPVVVTVKIILSIHFIKLSLLLLCEVIDFKKERFILSHGFGGSWLVGPIVFWLWLSSTSWPLVHDRAICLPHGSQYAKGKKEKEMGSTSPFKGTLPP
jgi:hypothetical protein